MRYHRETLHPWRLDASKGCYQRDSRGWEVGLSHPNILSTERFVIRDDFPRGFMEHRVKWLRGSILEWRWGYWTLVAWMRIILQSVLTNAPLHNFSADLSSNFKLTCVTRFPLNRLYFMRSFYGFFFVLRKNCTFKLVSEVNDKNWSQIEIVMTN